MRNFALDALTADYLVQTYATPADVKISKLATPVDGISEVLTIVKVSRVYNAPSGEYPSDTMARVLSKLLGDTP